MSAFNVEIRTKIMGSKVAEESALSNVVLELLSESITVAELIARTVEEQIQEAYSKQLDQDQIRQALNRQYFTQEDIDQQIAHDGSVRKARRDPMLQIPQEIQRAQNAFDRNIFLLVVDGQQATELNEMLHLKATSKITFLRLTPLVGG